jgi:hypothetical protein
MNLTAHSVIGRVQIVDLLISPRTDNGAYYYVVSLVEGAERPRDGSK